MVINLKLTNVLNILIYSFYSEFTESSTDIKWKTTSLLHAVAKKSNRAAEVTSETYISAIQAP